MVLRAAIVLLLMLNLGAAAWWWLGDAGASATPGAAPVDVAGAPRLRLVSEIAPRRAAPAQEPAAAAALAVPLATAELPASPDTATSGQCARLGPFEDVALRDAARPALAAIASTVVARDTPARATRGWWVFLPALPSRDQARALGERIRAAGITDWYVMNEGDQANSIALGRYGSEEAARRREAELRAKGFPAQAAPLGARTAQWWLDVRLAAGASPASLDAIAPSTRIGCASLR